MGMFTVDRMRELRRNAALCPRAAGIPISGSGNGRDYLTAVATPAGSLRRSLIERIELRLTELLDPEEWESDQSYPSAASLGAAPADKIKQSLEASCAWDWMSQAS
jgi:hypothetical protein